MDSSSGVPQIVGQIANHEPTMFGQIKMHAWITKRIKLKYISEERGKIINGTALNINYAIEMNNKILPKGHYTYHVKMVSGKENL